MTRETPAETMPLMMTVAQIKATTAPRSFGVVTSAISALDELPFMAINTPKMKMRAKASTVAINERSPRPIAMLGKARNTSAAPIFDKMTYGVRRKPKMG
jgi:hypothetical protein